MNILKMHIPSSTPNNRRPGTPLTWTTVTIHNTGNPRSTARNERAWLTNPSNTRTASFHYAVDAADIVEVIPPNEVAWHAGDAAGNRSSIGIEICESGNYSLNVENAVELAAHLLKTKGLDARALRQHHDWSRKDCPWKIRRGHEGWNWDAFKRAVNDKLTENTLLINNRRVDVPLKIENGRTYVLLDGPPGQRYWIQIRALSDLLGARLEWEAATRTARMTIR